MKTTLTSAVASALLASSGVSAFWRLPCNNVLIHERSDPIVNPGVTSGHVHNVVGGSNFGPNADFASLRESECTSCMVTQDLSAYWHPQLYFEYANGTFQSVDNGGSLIYYLPRFNKADTTNVTAFPDGFRMLTGNMPARSYDASSQMATQIGWNCLGSNSLAPGGATRQPYLPPYNCPDGLRGEIMFPSCWDGKNLDSANHMSHMAYPIGGESGPCPAGYPVRLITLFFEVMYSVDAFKADWSLAKNTSQPFVLAMGDPTGYGWHGDFLNGWDNAVLQEAIDTCSDPNSDGVIEECAVFDLSDTPCRKTPDFDEIVVSTPNTIHLLSSLPGNNPVQNGPATATIYPATPALAFQEQTAYTALVAPPGASVLSDAARVIETVGQWTHQACYSDPGSPRVLTNGLTNSNNTVEGALAACQAKGYSICGIEYGGETWGANTLGSTSTVLDYGSCDMACNGNHTQLCGGSNAIDLYTFSGAAVVASSATTATATSTKTGAPTATVPQTAPVAGTATSVRVVQSSGSYTYQACYSDSGSPRTLPNGLTNSAKTVAGAIAACAAKGYTYCGIEYGGETWGANMFNSNAAEIDSSKCSMTCTGDNTEICGGNNAMTVYSLNNAAVVISTPPKVIQSSGSWVSQGCYSDPGTPRVLPNGITNSNATIEGALAGCLAKGYKLCGVEYGGETWAANSLASTSTALDQSKCNMICNGNAGEYCGGSSALQLYSFESSSSKRVRRQLAKTERPGKKH